MLYVQHSDGTTEVAVKMLHSESAQDRVRFLQEGAIMGQFKHKHIVSLYGMVVQGHPVRGSKPQPLHTAEGPRPSLIVP